MQVGMQGIKTELKTKNKDKHAKYKEGWQRGLLHYVGNVTVL